MLAHRVIPTLLMKGETLVKGSRFQSWRSVGHVRQAVRVYQQRQVDEIILLDIAATPEGRGPDFALIESLAADSRCPMTVGGGVRSVEDVRQLLACGADKVAICTAAREKDIIRATSDRFGSQAIVAALDAKWGSCWTHCGQSNTFVGVDWVADRRFMHYGAGEILLTSIDREGTLEGYDLDLIRSVSEAVSIPVIAHGGCSGYEDMANAIRAGASAVAAGALWHFTDSTPREAARYLNERGIKARVA